MIYDRETVAALENLAAREWEGVAFRHMFGEFPPERQNSRGARWNPPETPAIYTSLERETALAEAEYQINLQPFRPKASRSVYRLEIRLDSVLDLSDWATLRAFGIDEKSFASLDYSATQMLGGAVEWLKHDGVLIPSARANGTNLVIFPNQQSSRYKFEAVDREILPVENG